MFVSQRFGHKKVTVEPVGQAKSSRDPERQTDINVAQRPTNSGTKNKTESKSNADYAEGSRAFFFRCHVCDVGHCCGNTRGRDSRNDASEEQPANRGRER